MKKWLSLRLNLIREITRSGQSTSYRVFRLKELFGIDPDPETKEQRALHSVQLRGMLK